MFEKKYLKKKKKKVFKKKKKKKYQELKFHMGDVPNVIIRFLFNNLKTKF